jgi:hypothetical protein
MILHHIYKELNLLLYIFINLRDFWFVILINFYEIQKLGSWKMKIDCLYELFVTHLGCSLFKSRRMVTISS